MPKRHPRITTPCFRCDEVQERIDAYVEALIKAAPSIGDHGLSEEEFRRSGLFRSAVERIRGTQAASMQEKRDFVDWALSSLEEVSLIKDHAFTGAGDRHDYHVTMPDNTQSIFEAKGCLDGNNTTIFERPANADEFLIWSLCQNPGSDPRKNVWSGIHTRLGGKIIAEKERIEALIVWDMLCGTQGRPCPKIDEGRGKKVNGRTVPPPCVYLFPRTVPDPRNNPAPDTWNLHEIKLANALIQHFGGDERDVTKVHIECKMESADILRKTTLIRAGETVAASPWTKLKRAR